MSGECRFLHHDRECQTHESEAALCTHAAQALQRRVWEAVDAERALNCITARVSLQPTITAKANVALDDYRLLASRLASLEARNAALHDTVQKAGKYIYWLHAPCRGEVGPHVTENSAAALSALEQAVAALREERGEGEK